MTQVQNYVMQDRDQDEASNVDEKPLVSKLILPQVGPSGEILESSGPSTKSFQEELEEQLR